MPTIDTLEATIYRKLELLAGDLTRLRSSGKSHADGFMPLCMDRLIQGAACTRIALAHNFEMNGDLVPDPDMEIAIYTESKRAEALSFQDQRHYVRVYDESGQADAALSLDLNRFLILWLGNLAAQGHSLKEQTKVTT